MVNSHSSQVFGEDTTFRGFLNPIHGNVNVTMGQHLRVTCHANALSHPITVVEKPVTVDEHPVTKYSVPVLVETVKRRKTCVERFSSYAKKVQIELHHTRTSLTTIAEVWKECNCGLIGAGAKKRVRR